MARAVAYLIAHLESDDVDDGERRQVLGILGVYSRLLGDLERAAEFLLQAIALAEQLRQRPAVIANRIRLANVYQWQGAFSQSDAIYADVINECETDPELQRYLDFAFQHYGKSLFDQRRYAEATICFQRALDLRLGVDDADLIESTQLALRTARARASSGCG